MKQIKCENSEIKLITHDFREIIGIYGFKYKKKRLSKLRKTIRDHEKIVTDKKEDDIEYLQDRINYLNSLKMDILNKINIKTKISNIMELKLLGIDSMMMMKITIYIQQLSTTPVIFW